MIHTLAQLKDELKSLGYDVNVDFVSNSITLVRRDGVAAFFDESACDVLMDVINQVKR